jgi:hypothetical protein
MSVQIYDAQTVLIPTGTITADTTFPALRVQVGALPTCAWVIHVQSITAGTTLTLMLEAATTEAGVYSPISRFDWPVGLTGRQQVALGVSASAARYATASSRVSWLRVTALVSGAGASVTLQAWLTKFGGGIGVGMKPGDLVTAP